MNIKKLLTALIAIVIIFLSYNFLTPINQASSLVKSDYSISKGGENSIGVITFKKSNNIILTFFVNKGSNANNIECIVKKNGKEFKRLIANVQKKKNMIIPILKNDNIEIIIKKYGAGLEIKIQEPAYYLKNFIVPFLWAMLFIFLLGKNHKYIGINAYVGFILVLFAEILNFGPLSFNSILIYMLFIFSMTFIFTLIYQELNILKKYKVASIISYIVAISVYSIPLFFIIYALNYDTPVTKDILYAVFQSNTEESMEYISDFIALKYILLFIFITAFIGFILYQQEKKETQKIEKSLLIFLILIFLSISLLQFTSLRLPAFLISGFEKYNYELTQFKKIQAKRKTGEITFKASKNKQGETYVIMIGESLNKKHMGIYGYMRDTTPLLSKMNKEGKLNIFNNVYSNHTHTGPVLRQALTEANQYNHKNYYNSLSIIDVLKQANVETYWITNQTIYGPWDNTVSVIGKSADHLITINKSIGKQTKTQKLDGALIDKVKKVLAEKSKKTRVIFVHLIGSHASYLSRYPHDNTFTRFQKPLKYGEFGIKAATVKSINAYDNSVLYNDYVVSSILKEFQKSKDASAFIYMSDHADDVINQLAHNSAKFTYYMTQVPLLTWFSDSFKKEYPKKYSNLLSRSETLFSNDMLYNTMLGIFGIKTDKYNAIYDFSSDKYKLESKDALVLHGKKHYTDKSNHLYWQKTNAKYLIDSNQSSRIFPHRVNSVGKLKDIWNNGFRSFEVDVRFGDHNTRTYTVEHDKDMGDTELDKFLSYIDTTKIQQVWLDFKNLNAKNYTQALERLEYLDNKYHIKDKFIVESGTTKEFFKLIRAKGWHTSYYLPTNKIVKLLKDNNISGMESISEKIAYQTQIQALSAVSFDHRLYPFVKKYLEPKITNNIVYHIWYAPPLYNTDFKDKLLKNKLYKDNRVKTLLTTYKSQFNL